MKRYWLLTVVMMPVPASLVMIAHGTLFGVLGGTLLSLAEAMEAALCGFALRRRGGPLLARLPAAAGDCGAGNGSSRDRIP